MTGFKIALIVMLFYSVSINMLSYTIPAGARDYVTMNSLTGGIVDVEDVGAQVEESVTRQTDIPVIEVGALVFYSGNILIDLLLNFAFAIPQMFGLILHGITLLINVNTYLWAQLEIFAAVLMLVLYMVGLIQLITGVRSGRLV